ncbi:MAG: hypothetical protein Q7J47_20380 [Azoarcus sp.]|nr:hypothetical protein [Azoarcus sp.]
MQTKTTQHSFTENLDDEHLPPLEAFETWASTWQRQLEAARAWQEAHGNTDGEACQWRGAVSASRPLMERRKRIVTIDFADRRRAA